MDLRDEKASASRKDEGRLALGLVKTPLLEKPIGGYADVLFVAEMTKHG